MKPVTSRTQPTALTALFEVLNPIPFGLFVGALAFDVVYDKTANVLWVKSAAWLICGALVMAVIPRLIHLARVWFHRGPRAASVVIAFWLNVGAIVAGIVNAFVHSRDAYAVMPDGVWLSALTVALLIAGNVASTLQLPHTDAALHT